MIAHCLNNLDWLPIYQLQMHKGVHTQIELHLTELGSFCVL